MCQFPVTPYYVQMVLDVQGRTLLSLFGVLSCSYTPAIPRVRSAMEPT